MKNNDKGFSLVELIVVIAIMAVLVGVLSPTLLRYVEKARVQRDASAISELAEAIVLSAADEDVYKEINDGKTTVTLDTDGVITVSGALNGTTAYSDQTKSNLYKEISYTIGTYEFSSSNKENVVISVYKDVASGIVSTKVTKVGNTEIYDSNGTVIATNLSEWATAIVNAGKH